MLCVPLAIPYILMMANKQLGKTLGAFAAYVAFAVYLYQPYIGSFGRWQYLLLINPPLASLGCFVLSRRWVESFAGSFFAGAIYGFGPFMLGLTRFHPTAGFLAATIPWLFCPAAFICKTKWSWKEAALSLLPFLAIIVFFQATVHYHLFAVPRQARLHPADLFALIAPLVSVRRGLNLIGFYHIPMAALVMGFSMLLAARRLGIMTLLLSGIVLALCKPFLDVSPIIWFAVPAVCCSVITAGGIQGLVLSGFADRKLVLAIAIFMGGLAIVTLLLATKYFQVFAGLASGYARVLTDTGKLFILGTLVTATIFFMARLKVRILWVRRLILCSAMAVDIFLGARFIVDWIT